MALVATQCKNKCGEELFLNKCNTTRISRKAILGLKFCKVNKIFESNEIVLDNYQDTDPIVELLKIGVNGCESFCTF